MTNGDPERRRGEGMDQRELLLEILRQLDRVEQLLMRMVPRP